MRRFVVLWFSLTLLTTMCVAAFNWAVDPYWYFAKVPLSDLGAKPQAGLTLAALAKSSLLPRRRPTTLLLGSSKADIGIDADSPLWPSADRPVFNDGVPGQATADMLGNLEAALHEAPVRRVLLCLDLVDFMNVPTKVTVASIWQSGSGDWEHLRKTTHALLTSAAVRDSILTVLARNGVIDADISDNGNDSAEDLRRAIRQIGPDEMFVQRLGISSIALGAIAEDLARTPNGNVAQLDVLRRIITLCQSRGITLDIAITPAHSDYLSVINQDGLWPRYLQTKRALTALVAGFGGVSLWDFMGFDDISTEVIAPPGVPGMPRWYYEPSHFTHAVGEKMLATIYQADTSYGVRLTPQNLEAHLRDEEAARARFWQSAAMPGLDRIRRARSLTNDDRESAKQPVP